MEIITFEEALRKSQKQPHLLLGNGFSIGCKEDIFSYKSLFETADFTELSGSAKSSFDEFFTHDFELIIQKLKDATKVWKLYCPQENEILLALQKDMEALKRILIKTISDKHPSCPSEIEDCKYVSCRKFLNHFKTFYTVNYDLLLYWALLYDKDGFKIKCDDGFRSPENPDEDYVSWEMNVHSQNVFYLHGALHIFDRGAEFIKFTWLNTGVRLLAQINEAMQSGMFPLFVSEGSWKKKAIHINHNSYLGRGMRSLAQIRNSLFIYGMSLSENDEHILQILERGNLEQIFISLYGNVNDVKNQNLISRAMFMKQERRKRFLRPLEIEFFESASANVWDNLMVPA